MPPGRLGWSLFSFNVGVEIGQLCVVVPLALALRYHLETQSISLAKRIADGRIGCRDRRGRLLVRRKSVFPGGMSMKRAIILSTSIAAAGLATAALYAQPRGGGLPPIEKIQLVKGNLYKIFGAGGNTTVFVSSKGVVLVDTKLANNGQQILDQVRTVTDKPVTMVINTHVHPDHNGSNQFFKDKWANIDVVLQDNSAALVAKNKHVDRRPEADQDLQGPAVARRRQGPHRPLLFRRRPHQWRRVVVFPALRAMCIGDLMAWNMAPLIDPGSGGSVVALPDTLEKAVKTHQGRRSGHRGPRLREQLGQYRALRQVQPRPAGGIQEGDGGRRMAQGRAGGAQGQAGISAADPGQDAAGLEYGGTASGRVLINARVAFRSCAASRSPPTLRASCRASRAHRLGHGRAGRWSAVDQAANRRSRLRPPRRPGGN